MIGFIGILIISVIMNGCNKKTATTDTPLAPSVVSFTMLETALKR